MNTMDKRDVYTQYKDKRLNWLGRWKHGRVVASYVFNVDEMGALTSSYRAIPGEGNVFVFEHENVVRIYGSCSNPKLLETSMHAAEVIVATIMSSRIPMLGLDIGI